MNADKGFTSHKFRALNENLWRSLESSQFYFAAPENLNDPADCQVDLAKAFRLARADGRENEEWFRRYREHIEGKARTCGVFSLCSGSIDGDGERLLWAHYAMNHTGICITFDIPYKFVMERLMGSAPVQYSHEALYRALNALDPPRKANFKEMTPVITAFLTTKSSKWAYEKESRLISFEPGLLAFERSWLKQICFGLRTSEADRARLKEMSTAYPECRLAEAVRSDDALFGLSLRDVD